jgi:hypothetical protein
MVDYMYENVKRRLIAYLSVLLSLTQNLWNEETPTANLSA